MQRDSSEKEKIKKRDSNHNLKLLPAVVCVTVCVQLTIRYSMHILYAHMLAD